MNSTSLEVTSKPCFCAEKCALTEKLSVKAGVSRIELCIDGNESVMVGQFRQASHPLSAVIIRWG